MKLFSILFVLIPLLGLCQSEEYKNMLKEHYNDFPTISPEQAKYKLNSNGVFFLDTRSKDEYNISHLENAIQVGYNDFSLSSVRFIPKNAEIIVYCSIGARSQNIGEQLKKAGYTRIKNLYGGLFHWANIGYPMVDSKGNDTKKIHGYSKDWGKWVKNGMVVY